MGQVMGLNRAVRGLAALALWTAASSAVAQHVAQVEGMGGASGTFTASAHDTSSTLALTVPFNTTRLDRMILVISSDPTAAAPTITDPTGNAWAVDATRNNTGNVRTTVMSAMLNTALTTGQVLTINFGTPAPTAKAVVGAVFTGLLRNATGVLDRAANPNAGLDNVTTTPTATTADTRHPFELVLHVLGVEGDSADVAGVTAAGGTVPAAPALVGSVATSGSGGAAANVGAVVRFSQVTATGAYASQWTLLNARSVAVLTTTYRAGPSEARIVLPLGTPAFAASNTAGVCTGPFRVQLFNTIGTQVAATASTNIAVVSNSPSDRLWTNNTCTAPNSTGATTLTLNFPAGTVVDRDFYVRDARRSNPNWTLTATRTGGNPNISAASKDYIVNAGSPSRVWVRLPGQVFTEGTGVTGADSVALVGTPFAVGLHVTDALNNLQVGNPALDNDEVGVVFTGLNGTPGYSFTGPGTCSGGCSVSGPASLPVRFVDAASVGTLTATPSVVQTNAVLTAALASPTVSGGSTQFNVTSAVPTITLVSPTTGIMNRGPGTMVVRVNNTGTGVVNRIQIFDPTSWNLTGGASSSAAGCSNTVTVNASNIEFTCTLAVGASVDLTVNSIGNVYPNLSVDTASNVRVDYRIGGTTNTVNRTFNLNLPLAPPQLPMVIRNPTGRPALQWTQTDVSSIPAVTLTGARASGGTLVIRGTATPADGVSYAVGDALGGSSTVVCIATTGEQSCTESALVTENTGTSVYGFFNRDQQAAPIYSNRVGVTVPLRPTVGWVAATSVGSALRAMGLRRATATQPGVVVVPMGNPGIFFLRTAAGAEHRRAEPLGSSVQRRPSVTTLSTMEVRTFAGEGGLSNQRLHRMDLAAVEPSTSVLVNSPVGSSVVSLQRNLATGLNATYSTDVLFLGTNAANNNTFRAVRPDLTSEYWSFPLLNTADSIRADPYVDYATSWAIVPVATGGGGLLGFDLSQAGSPPPRPAPWSTRTILGGTTFACQPRKLAGHYVVGSSVTPNSQMFAINPATATSGGTTSFTLTGEGGVKQVVPQGSNGILYATSTKVGALTLATSPLGITRNAAFTTWDSGGDIVGGITVASGFIFVGVGNRVVKLSATTGLEVADVTLDPGAFGVSEVAVEGFDGVIVAGTDTGAIYGIPLF